jgi:hypothetical protein
VSFRLSLPTQRIEERRWSVNGRCFGFDVHRDFVEVAVWQDGQVTQLGRVAARSGDLERFA